MAVVYLHKRNDTNEVFYVGIGKEVKRAFDKSSRNKYWKHIVEKYGYIVDILVSETPWEDACKIEKLLIEKYGRKDLGLGNLVNMTDGGDGAIGIILSDKHKQKISEARKGKTSSEETRQKIRELKKGNTYMKGKNHSNETKQKLSEAHIGKTHSDETIQKMRLSKRNKEGVKGYYVDKLTNKCVAQIKVGGKKSYLGSFNTPEEAELAYKQAKLKYHI